METYMDDTRLAFEQWWAGRVASDDAKAGAWAAWLYLTGNETLYRQRGPIEANAWLTVVYHCRAS